MVCRMKREVFQDFMRNTLSTLNPLPSYNIYLSQITSNLPPMLHLHHLSQEV